MFPPLKYLTGGAPILTRPHHATWESTHFIFSSKSSKFSGTSSPGFSGYHVCQKAVLSCSICNTLIRKVKPKEVKLCEAMQQVNRCGWHWLLLQLHLLISGGNLMLNDHVLQKRSKVKIPGTSKSCKAVRAGRTMAPAGTKQSSPHTA